MTLASPPTTADPILDLFPAGRQWESWIARAEQCIEEHSGRDGAFSTSRAIQLGERDEFCEAAVDAWKAAGLMEVFVPPELGGCGDFPMIYRVCALLASREPSIASTLGAVALGTLPIRIAGNAEQRGRWFARVREGDLAGLALTEDAHGSDLTANEMVARRVRVQSEGGASPEHVSDDSYTHYQLTGKKHTINNGSRAGFLVVMARTTLPADARTGSRPASDAAAHSLLVVDMHSRGIKTFARRYTHGFRSVDISDVGFEDCLVDRSDLLGAETQGFRIARRTLEISRGGISAFAVGQLFGALQIVKRCASERRLYGGHPVSSFPIVADTLAETYASVELTAALSAWAARVSAVAPVSAPPITAAAKCFAPAEAARRIGDLALVLGARGLMREHPFERFRRDVAILPVFDGTTNIQRVELLLHLRRPSRGDADEAPDAAAELQLAREIWARDDFGEVDLLRGDAALPRTDPRALEAYHGLHRDCGFLALAAARHVQRRIAERCLEDRPAMPGPLSTTLEEGRLADALARTEATIALAFRVATAAPAAPASHASPARRAALELSLGVLALEILGLSEQQVGDEVDSLMTAGERTVLRAAVAQARCSRTQKTAAAAESPTPLTP